MDDVDVLRKFRDINHLTQRAAADLTGYGFAIWASYESGRRIIPRHLLVQLHCRDRIVKLEGSIKRANKLNVNLRTKLRSNRE